MIKKKLNKILLTVGAATAASIPIATVIACGEPTKGKENNLDTLLDIKDINNALNKLEIKVTGVSGAGRLNSLAPIKGATFLYGLQIDQQSTPSYTKTPPTNLANGQFL
jgi:hypothetical protein